jgi:hypothetical protein
MQSNAYCSDVQEVIVRHLESATLCLEIYLDFFTNRDVFDLIVMRQRRGVQVTFVLLDVDSNRQSTIAWERLTALGGVVFWLPELNPFNFDSSQQFFVVDSKLVVSGNFNLGKRANPAVPAAVLIQLDQTTKSYFEDIFKQLHGEKSVESTDTNRATSLIENPKIQSQRTQEKLLQARIFSIESEITEIQRQIHQFEHQKDQSIGELIRCYLDVKRRYMHQVYRGNLQEDSKSKADEADRTYRQYGEAREEKFADINPTELSVEQLDELKLLYRKLAMQCHPDRVDEAHKASAQSFFQQLQLNYKNNDLVSLKNLKVQIEAQQSAPHSLKTPDEFARLSHVLAELQNTIARLTQQLTMLTESATWNELNTHLDWDALFSQRAVQLEREMQRYMKKLEHAQHAD